MENDNLSELSLGWSDFALGRHKKGGKHTWFAGSSQQLLDLVRARWSERRPGAGRENLEKVVIVPVDPAGFISSTVLVAEDTPLRAIFDRRQQHEAGFVRVVAEGPREKAEFASVVLYSADTLLENDGTRSGDCDWEVVCLLAGPTADEPMDPLTMARNMLEKPGGTYCRYTAEEFAESVWYWSLRAAAYIK